MEPRCTVLIKRVGARAGQGWATSRSSWSCLFSLITHWDTDCGIWLVRLRWLREHTQLGSTGGLCCAVCQCNFQHFRSRFTKYKVAKPPWDLQSQKSFGVIGVQMWRYIWPCLRFGWGDLSSTQVTLWDILNHNMSQIWIPQSNLFSTTCGKKYQINNVLNTCMILEHGQHADHVPSWLMRGTMGFSMVMCLL